MTRCRNALSSSGHSHSFASDHAHPFARLLVWSLAILLLTAGVLSEENSTPLNTSTNLSSPQNATNSTQSVSPQLNQTPNPTSNPPSNSTSNSTSNTSEVHSNPITILPQNATPPSPEPEPEPKFLPSPVIISFDVQKILPGDVHLGDNQINILVSNTGNQVLTNINAVIAGEGISVYTQEPIGFLSPGDSKWILAWINAKKSGKIPIDIRIADRIFRLNLNVVDSDQSSLQKKDAEEAISRRRKIREIQEDLANLSDVYESFARDYTLKESKGFILTNINLQDAKTYLRTAQSSLAKDELSDAGANLVLLRTELADVREKLSNAQPKPRTWKDPIKENVGILSGIVGVLVGGLAVYEKLKSKREAMRKNGGWFGERPKGSEPKEEDEESGEE